MGDCLRGTFLDSWRLVWHRKDTSEKNPMIYRILEPIPPINDKFMKQMRSLSLFSFLKRSFRIKLRIPEIWQNTTHMYTVHPVRVGLFPRPYYYPVAQEKPKDQCVTALSGALSGRSHLVMKMPLTLSSSALSTLFQPEYPFWRHIFCRRVVHWLKS